MIITPSTPIDLQTMLFGTTAGQTLLGMCMDAGHFNEELEDDKARIEHNLILQLLREAGGQVILKPRILVVPAEAEGENLIDKILSEGNEDA